MSSKTPLFDSALAEYYGRLEFGIEGGMWRACRFSGRKFYIEPEDVEFYKNIGAPLPTLAPLERLRRRYAYCNSHNLFRVVSAHSGKPIIAAYPPDTSFKIYEHQVWFSDAWDPLQFGRAYDANRDAFSQFQDLQLAVPRPNLIVDSTSVGSDFTNTSTRLKNCYLTFDTLGGEDLCYFQCCADSKNCIDCDSLWRCDTCYGCQDLEDSFRCFFVFESKQCIDSAFLFDCRNCSDCFMSANLRNKKYVFRNKQLTKEDYRQKLKEVTMGDYAALQKYRTEFSELKMAAAR